jgi:uncharacterized RDD family membrane protein YckC
MASGRTVPVVNTSSYEVERRLTEGVIGRRFWAYLIDLFVIMIWICVICLAITIFGIITLGLGWLLFTIGLPLAGLTFIIYNAVTIGGPSQATVGMRAMGLRVVDATTGGRVSMLAAAVHAVLFYVAWPTFLLWAGDILIGFFRNDRRFARDLITNVLVIRD